MDLLHLVDRLEELVAGAQKMPIGSRAIVDRRRLLDVIDQMRVTVPGEVREAQEIVAQREAYERAAEEESSLIVARAEEQAARLIDEHTVTEAARKRAEEIAVQAEGRLEERIRQANGDIEARIVESRRLADQQMRAADEYAKELLVRLEHQLQAFVRSIQSGIVQLDDREPQTDEEPVAEPAVQEMGGPFSGLTTDDAPPASAAAAPAAGWAAGLADRASTDRVVEDRAIEDRAADPGPESWGALFDLPAIDEQADADARSGERSGRQAPPVPAPDPGVIDDFAMPQLDDQPRSDAASDRDTAR